MIALLFRLINLNTIPFLFPSINLKYKQMLLEAQNFRNALH